MDTTSEILLRLKRIEDKLEPLTYDQKEQLRYLEKRVALAESYIPTQHMSSYVYRLNEIAS